jgi:competence protein ComEA
MPEFNPRQMALYGLGLLALVVLAAWYLGHGDRASAAPAAGPPRIAVQDDQAANGGELVVHVAGAVRRPGVYRLRSGSRVDDAVARAGGPRRRADLSALNLAAELEDGRQVLVPPRATAATGAAAGVATAPAQPGVPLNLNTATPEQLDELDGIGPATAKQIVAYREAHGGFGSVDELDQVPGIGETRLASLREQVRV